jgi:hypothetical protein
MSAETSPRAIFRKMLSVSDIRCFLKKNRPLRCAS